MIELRSKYTSLENKSLTTINQLQSQITKLNLQLQQQSAFSFNIGYTFGFHLWEATQIPSVVDKVLQIVNIYLVILGFHFIFKLFKFKLIYFIIF